MANIQQNLSGEPIGAVPQKNRSSSICLSGWQNVKTLASWHLMMMEFSIFLAKYRIYSCWQNVYLKWFACA